MLIREKELERKLAKAARAAGGLALKFVSPGFDGMPDRIILFHSGKIGFVEVKRPGRKPKPLQTARHGMLRHLGFLVFVLDDEGKINNILEEIKEWNN
jgi:hypothetical protein